MQQSLVDGDKKHRLDKIRQQRCAKKIRIEAGEEILLVFGQSRVKLSEKGTMEINGQQILQLGDKLVSFKSDSIRLH